MAFLDYRPAHLVRGKKNIYVAYSVINPENGKMIVKRVKLNHLQGKRQQTQYAEELIKQINSKLAGGFNPFTDSHGGEKLILLSVAVTDFLKHKRRQLDTGDICPATFDDYKQQLYYYQQYMQVDCYLHKIKAADVAAFLDDIYINKRLTACTYNHYLQSLKAFFNFCKQRGYITALPTDGISNARNAPKRRAAIPADVLKRIFDYLSDTGEKHYLLACYLLYGCFIRPSEICGLQINDISFANQTITVKGSISKNKKTQIVTMPQNVCEMLLDLQIYNYPGDYYIISRNFKPGAKKVSEKGLRKKWLLIRAALHLPTTYQFYSLKDSGITQMIDILNVAEVRDQARHSSIAITDVYTDRSKNDGNAHIKRLRFTPGAKGS